MHGYGGWRRALKFVKEPVELKKRIKTLYFIESLYLRLEHCIFPEPYSLVDIG